MRTSLAIACLAGVALASKSKSYRNKHTADTAETAFTAERPADPCLTEDAWNYISDTACDDIWMAWEDYCFANMTDQIITDECNQAYGDVWKVPDQAPAPDVACDIGYWPYESEVLVCNNQWIAFDNWCGWWDASEDLLKECQDVYDATEDRIYSDDQDMVVMRTTQMQKKHSLQQKKRAGKKQQTAAAAAPRPTGKCLTEDAYYNRQDNECDGIWEAWNQQCANDWTEACHYTLEDIEYGVPDQAPAPDANCDSGFNYDSTDQTCNNAWEAFDEWCRWWGVPEDQKEVCYDVETAYWTRIYPDEALVVMQKTQMQKQHSLQQRKRAAGKRQQFEVAAWVPIPNCSFMTRDNDQECSEAWEAFMYQCWAGDKTEAQVNACDAGFRSMYGNIEELVDGATVMRKTTMQRKHELKKSAAGKHALKKTAAKERSGKKASVNLAASSSAANDGQYASGVAMGAAVGAAAALGALYAISKCNKGRVDDFQRV